MPGQRAVEKAAVDRAWILDRLRENVERAPCEQRRRSMRMGGRAASTATKAVANRVLELIGKELGMFKDQQKVKMVGRSIAEKILARRAQILREQE